MESTISENQKNVGALLHLSTFSKYFFPFANFFVPLLIWTFNKEKNFIDAHGRQAINFQLSIFLYSLLIGLICLPFFLIFAFDFVTLVESLEHAGENFSFHDITNLSGYIVLFSIAVLLLLGLFILELYAVISATIHASRGEMYNYPLCIPFINTTIQKQQEK
jgi:uncharacterized protein